MLMHDLVNNFCIHTGKLVIIKDIKEIDNRSIH